MDREGGDVPSGSSHAKRAQMDTQGRWTLKQGRKLAGASSPTARPAQDPERRLDRSHLPPRGPNVAL